MSYETDQVRKFYEVIWNQRNRDAIPEVLQGNVKFRGSLGQDKLGHAGFAEYFDMVHEALGEYQCVVDELVSEPGRVFAKMKFTGVHRGEFMGYLPTGKRVTRSVTACYQSIFTSKSPRNSDAGSALVTSR